MRPGGVSLARRFRARAALGMGLLLAVLLVPASSLAQEPIGNEVAEFDATQGLEERLAPIVQHVLANPDDFGGLYLDASANRLNVAIVDRSGRAESALRALGPVGVEIRVRPAIHTERELKQVSEEALLKSAEWLPKYSQS